MVIKIGFLGLLTLLFIGLKLGSLITWSWWWILAPIWIPITLGFIIMLFGFGISLFITMRN